MAEHITGTEFARFSERLFVQLDRLEAAQRVTNGRVTALETEQKINKRIAAYISAAIGGAVALAGLLMQYLRG